MTMTAAKPKYTAEVGTEAVLVCVGEEVNNDTFTWVHWEFNGTKLNTSTDHYEYATTYSNQGPNEGTPKVLMNLTIFDVDYADEGNYTCVVHSNNDRESDNTALEVYTTGMRFSRCIFFKGNCCWPLVELFVPL